MAVIKTDRKTDIKTEVRIKILPNGGGLELPEYKTSLSAGMDLRAAINTEIILAPGAYQLIPAGIAIELPAGLEAQIRPRSGLAINHGISILNTPGTIDADYRGEIKICLINFSKEPFVIKRGERIAQMVIAKTYQINWLASEELSETERNEGGFGSTGVH